MDKKLNIGVSEHNAIKDFLNIGLEFSHNGIIEKNGCRLLKHDVCFPLPIKNETVEFIYASHIVEHLTIKDFYFFIKECHRVLKMNGVLRIVCPDLKKWLNAYHQNDLPFFMRYHKIMKENKGKPWSTIDTDYMISPADYFMSNIHNWNHKWAFDLESIQKHLELCGFTYIINTGYRNSSYSNIADIEPEFHQLESLYIETIKI